MLGKRLAQWGLFEADTLYGDFVGRASSGPDRGRWIGRCDHALLLLAVQTGLRVSELSSVSPNRSPRARVAGLLATSYTASQTTYDLRRLRRKGLI